MTMRSFAHSRLGRPVALISITPGTPQLEASRLAKTLFELNRSELINPGMTGAALEEWRMSVHFTDYQGPQPWTAREITGQPLPADRKQRRHAWRDNGQNIISDPGIP